MSLAAAILFLALAGGAQADGNYGGTLGSPFIGGSVGHVSFWPTGGLTGGFVSTPAVGDGNPGWVYASWSLALEAGTYEIRVYVPNDHATASTRYSFNADDGAHSVLVRQADHRGTWVSLGSYRLSSGTAAVTSSDSTGAAGEEIAWDALGWVWSPPGAPTPAPPPSQPAPAPPPPPPAAAAPHFRIAGATIPVYLRAGPGTTYPIVGSVAPNGELAIACQTVGSRVNGSPIWDRLVTGAYVSDYWTSTPVFADFSPGISRCAGAPPVPPQGAVPPRRAYTVTGAVVAILRRGPGRSYTARGSVPGGTVISIGCQSLGEEVGGSRVWDRLADGRWIADVLTNTPLFGTYSPGLPRCPGAPAPPRRVQPQGPPPRANTPAPAAPALPDGRLPGSDQDLVKEIEIALDASTVAPEVGPAARLLWAARSRLAALVRTALSLRRVRLAPLTEARLKTFVKCVATRAGSKIVDRASRISNPGPGEIVSFSLDILHESLGCGRDVFAA